MCRTVGSLPVSILVSLAPVLADSFGPGFPGYTATRIHSHGLSTPAVPLSYGGLTLNPANINQLILGGAVSGAGAAFYSLNLVRDLNGRITGTTGGATLFATAPRLGASAVFGPAFSPGENLFYSIQSGSGGVDVGMIRWGTTFTSRTVNVVADSPGAIGFVPPAWNNSMEPKLLTSSGKFYSIWLEADGSGTYDVVIPQLRSVLPGAPLGGFAYVRGGSPGFPNDSLLVAETASGAIAAYNITAVGDPIPATRRVFFSGPPFARPSGLFIDPLTNDLLVSTAINSSSAVYRISGFMPPQPLLLSSCGSLTPGSYYLDGNLTQSVAGAPCIAMQNTSQVELDCRGHSIQGDTAIAISNSADLVVKNCNVPLSPGRYMLNAENSRRLILMANTFGSVTDQNEHLLRLYKTHNSDIVNNTVNGSLVQSFSVGNFIRSNRFICPDRHCLSLIWSKFGGSHAFDSNIIDGRAAPSQLAKGGWYGIQIENEGRDMVTSNEIRRIIDTAIQTHSLIQDSQINGNRVSETGAFAIAGRVHIGWLRNTIANNIADGVRFLIMIERSGGLRPPGFEEPEAPGDGTAFFADNVIAGNTLVNPSPFFGAFIAASSIKIANTDQWVNSDTASPGQPLTYGDVILRNNVFRNNNFTHVAEAPFFGFPVTPGIIIDGGGNICRKPTVAGYPLVCH